MNEQEKTNMINGIVMHMYEDIGHEAAKKLEAVLYISMQQYDIEKKTTEIALMDEDTTEKLLKRFIVAKKLKNCSDRTLKYYKTTLEKIFATVQKSPMEVTTDELRMYMLERQIKDKVSAVTINGERRALSSLFGWMQLEEIRYQNPMLKIDQLKEQKQKKEAYTEYELEKMRSEIKDDKDRALFEVLVSTWARVTEIANIKIEEIKDEQVIVHGKGGKDRTVFLTPKAQIAIQRYLSQRTDENIYLFPKKTVEHGGTCKGWWKYKEWVDPDNHTDISTIECMVRNLGKKNKIKAHPHKFRRTGATMALRRGMPLMQVSKTLGHESVETTQIYLDISDQELKDAHMKYC